MCRPEEVQGLWASVREACTCLGRQFLPNVVTREEFSLMRCAFMLTHHIRSSARFSFLDYLTLAMEDDFAHVVGLGLPMWCFIIVFVLLSSAIGGPPTKQECRLRPGKPHAYRKGQDLDEIQVNLTLGRAALPWWQQALSSGRILVMVG